MQTSTKYPVKNRRGARSFSTEKVLIDGMEVQFDERTGLVPVELVDKTWTGNAVRAMSNTLEYVNPDPHQAHKNNEVRFISSGARLLHKCFDCTTVSKRDFNAFHNHNSGKGDPHFTVGIGHWTYSNVFELFEKIKNDSKAWLDYGNHLKLALTGKYDKGNANLLYNVLVDKINSRFPKLKPLKVIPINKEYVKSGLDNPSGEGKRTYQFARNSPTVAEAQKIIERTLMSMDWLNAGKGNPEEFQKWPLLGEVISNLPKGTSYFENEWNKAFRLKSVAKVQLRHFEEENLAHQSWAIRNGIKTQGGIASVCLYNSSKTYKKSTVQKLDSDWDFDEMPDALLNQEKVSEAIEEDESRKEKFLQDWRAYLVWAAYRLVYKRKPHGVRDRNAKAWKIWFKDTWGDWPEEKAGIPTHTGVHMKTGKLI